MPTSNYSSHFHSGETTLDIIPGVELAKSIPFLPFTVEGRSGDLGTFLSGSYTVGTLTGGLSLDINGPNLGAYDLRYTMSTSVDTPAQVGAGDTFSITIGDEFNSTAAAITATTLSLAGIELNANLHMDQSKLDIDGLIEVIGQPLIPYDKVITVGPYDKSFTLLELTPGTPNKELNGALDDVEITFNLPSPDDPETASVTAASAQGTLAPVTIAVRSADPVLAIESNLLELISNLLEFAPTPDLKAFGEALDLLSEDFDLPKGYALEYTLLGLPINAGVSLEQHFTFTPDPTAATVSLELAGFTGDIGVEKGLGSSFTLTAPATVAEDLTGTAHLGLGGTLKVEYGLALTASIGYEVGSFGVSSSEILLPSLSVPGVSDSASIGKWLPLFTNSYAISPDDFITSFQFGLTGGGDDPTGDGNLHAYSDGERTLDEIAADLVGSQSGLSYVSGSATIGGAPSAVAWFDNLDFGTGEIGSGVFLSSGYSEPPRTNTSSGYGTSLNIPGDARLTSIVSGVFPNQPQSYDASTFKFSFEVADSTATTVRFDVLFGSDEYPEFVDSFVDIGAVFVNGTNYAYFNGSPDRPLSVISPNVNEGYFVGNSGLPIEYDGVSNKLTIVAPVNQGINTIEIAIADTGDHVLDTGIAVANLRLAETGGSGTKLLVEATDPSDHLYVATSNSAQEYYVTGSGDDYVDAKGGDDVIDLGDGNDTGYGGDGDDQMIGGSGDDKLYAGNGNDLLVGANGAGNDLYDGGAGTDTLTLKSAVASLLVDLTQGQASGADIGTDQLISLENVVGGAGNDMLIGDAGANEFEGGAGDDIIDGSAGSDTVHVTGNRADYTASGFASSLRLVDTVAGRDGSDTLLNVEQVAFADGTVAVADLLPGMVSISGVSIAEGDGGSQAATFTVTRTGGAAAFDVGFATADGTAMAEDGDYAATSGVLHFGAGETSQTVTVQIGGDTMYEADQSFTVRLSGATGGAVIGGGTAVGTIVNDEAPPAQVQSAQGTAGNDLIVGSSAGDQIDGLAGDDTVFAQGGSDMVKGGAGADTLVGNADIFTKEADTLQGGAGDDVIYGEYTDRIDGGTGYDIAYAVNAYDWSVDLGTSSIELMIADFGNDTIEAGSQAVGVEVVASGGNDVVNGSAFGDRLWAGVGNDVVHGGAGDDMLFGDTGADTLHGDAGNDVIYADAADSLSGGDGYDVVYMTTGNGVTIDMAGQGIEFVIDQAGGNNTITAAGMGEGANVFTGAGNDAVTGSDHDDVLWSMAGADTLLGGAGNDVLVGGTGADVLNGGAGNDRIYLNSGGGDDGAADTVIVSAGSGADSIYDFTHGSDKIDMTALQTSFGALSITATNGNAIITIGGDQIVVIGQGGTMTTADFQF